MTDPAEGAFLRPSGMRESSAMQTGTMAWILLSLGALATAGLVGTAVVGSSRGPAERAAELARTGRFAGDRWR